MTVNNNLYAMPDIRSTDSRGQPHIELHVATDQEPSIDIHVPESATYQDPTTIQHETAPTGDLYAIPDKNVAKQVCHIHSMYHNILWHSKPC